LDLKLFGTIGSDPVNGSEKKSHSTNVRFPSFLAKKKKMPGHQIAQLFEGYTECQAIQSFQYSEFRVNLNPEG
jgi:hypothetical protein